MRGRLTGQYNVWPRMWALLIFAELQHSWNLQGITSFSACCYWFDFDLLLIILALKMPCLNNRHLDLEGIGSREISG